MNKTEENYLEYLALCKELGYPTMEMHLNRKMILGNEVVVERDGRAHSWTRNAFNIILSQLGSKNIDDVTYGEGLISIKRTDDTIYSGAYAASIYSYNSVAGNSYYGIQVGSDDTGNAFDDHRMWTLITHGESAGKLSYWATNSSSAFTDGNTKFVTTITRYLNNNSGGDVTVNEIGLVAGLIRDGSYNTPDYGWPALTYLSYWRHALVCRDALAEPDILPHAMQYLVTYTMTLTYPL